MFLSTTHSGWQLCNKILVFSSHSWTVGKFYWSKCWCFPPTFRKRFIWVFFLETWGKLSRRVVSLVFILSLSVEVINLKNAVSEQLNKCVASEKSQDDFVKLKTVSKNCCSSLQSSRRCGWGRSRFLKLKQLKNLLLSGLLPKICTETKQPWSKKCFPVTVLLKIWSCYSFFWLKKQMKC